MSRNASRNQVSVPTEVILAYFNIWVEYDIQRKACGLRLHGAD